MKKILIMFISLCMLVSFTGCTGVQKELMKAMSETSNWEATEVTQKGSIVVTAFGEEMQMNIESEGYTNAKDLSGMVKMKMSDPTGQMALPEMEMYMDEGKTYINKGYFEQAYTLSGLTVPKKLQAIEADYIGMADVNQIMGNMMNIMSVSEMNAKTYELYEKLGKEMGIDLEVKKEGNTYTINVDGKVLGEISADLMDSKKIESYLGIIKDTLGLDLTPFVGDMPVQNEEQTKQYTEMIQGVLENAQMNLKYTITDSEFTQDIQMNYDLQGIGMKMSLLSTSKKAEAKTVKLPEKRVDLSVEEYQRLMTPNMVVIELSEGLMKGMSPDSTPSIITIIQEGDETYVPVKTVMKELQYQVKYDVKTKSVTLVQGETVIPVKVIIKNQISYVSLSELQKQQFNVIPADQNTVMISE